MFIRPINVSFLHFQTFSTLSMLRNLSSKFNLLALTLFRPGGGGGFGGPTKI